MRRSSSHNVFLYIFSFNDGVASADCALDSLFLTFTRVKRHMIIRNNNNTDTSTKVMHCCVHNVS